MSYRDQHWAPGAPTERVALCGAKGSLTYHAPDPQQITCTKCSALYWKERVPANVECVRVKPEQLKGGRGAHERSVYAVVIDNQVRGFVGCRAGWGKGWGVWSTAVKDGADELCVGYEQERESVSGRYFHTVAFWSKEAAVCGMLHEMALGRAPSRWYTLPQLIEWRKGHNERQAKRRAEQEARDKAEAEEHDAMLGALAELSERTDLTNAQRVAAGWALAKIKDNLI